MSKKTLNHVNLSALGADRLADLLLEVSTGSADIKRRLRLELSHDLGAAELARDVQKRLVSLRRSKSFIGWRKRKALIKDLQTQVDMITGKIAPDEPTLAFDLLWQFIELAPSVYERVDDSRGEVGDVFRSALPALEEARGGTLVLEDIESLPQSLQARLLSWMNDQGTPAETRIVAISNLQEQGKTCEDVLRPDLYFRLAAMKITLPPLRQRGEDILMLFTQFGEQFAEEYGCDAPQVSAQEAAQLLQAPWPGNVRQLINIAERAVLQSRRGSGTIASLLMSDHEEMQPVMTTEGKPLKEYVEAFERMLIDNTMRRHKGSIASVMDELCLPRRTLNEKMAKYGLQRSDYL